MVNVTLSGNPWFLHVLVRDPNIDLAMIEKNLGEINCTLKMEQGLLIFVTIDQSRAVSP
jgi:hypothetical protein